jgi:valyl-tRNA synthetase
MANGDQNPHATSPAAPPSGKGELAKQYRPGEHEERIFARWQEAGAFHADPSKVDRDAPPDPAGTASKRPPYCVLIPPPNVTDRTWGTR